MLDEIGILLRRRTDLIPVREALRMGERQDVVDLYPRLSGLCGNKVWHFLDDRDSCLTLLQKLCPGWVHLGDVSMHKRWQAVLAEPNLGEYRVTRRLSDPALHSLLTLIIETHIDLIGAWITRLSQNDTVLRLELRDRLDFDLIQDT